MRTYTERELYDFVGRADTREKIAIAEKWLYDHVEDVELWDNLMRALSYMSLEICRRERA